METLIDLFCLLNFICVFGRGISILTSSFKLHNSLCLLYAVSNLNGFKHPLHINLASL